MTGYTAYARGEKISGSIVSRSANNETISGSKTYNSGYYPSNWTVTGLDTSDATATSRNIENGFTAYVNGAKITGIATGIVHGISKVNFVPDFLELRYLKGTSINGYALFAGGLYNSSNYYNYTYAYDSSLTKYQLDDLSIAKAYLAATSIGDYALFAGGYGITEPNSRNTVDAYDTSLTKYTPTVLSQGKSDLAATSIGDYALFAGGSTDKGKNKPVSIVDSYNTSLTKSTAANLSYATAGLAGTSIEDYALFGGGYNDTTGSSRNYYAYVYTYNTSLVRSTTTTLSQNKNNLAATSINNYALFAGGGYYAGATSVTTYDTVDAYDNLLSKSTITSLSITGYPSSITIPEYYALFGIGLKVDLYDNSLVKSIATDFSERKDYCGTAFVGIYALFAGGSGSKVEGYYVS